MEAMTRWCRGAVSNRGLQTELRRTYIHISQELNLPPLILNVSDLSCMYAVPLLTLAKATSTVTCTTSVSSIECQNRCGASDDDAVIDC